MDKQQFRVLYREFLFRLTDVEVLASAARGDSNRLLGQFGSLLLMVSVTFSMIAMGFGGHMRPDQLVQAVWSTTNRMISTTMLAVGIFAILSWDATFLDRRDVLVLGPLPVRGRTMFLAKVAAVAMGLCVVIGALNCASGALLPLAMYPGSTFFGLVRFFVAYWATLLAAGTFLYCVILGVQGVAAQLPRRWFLRISSWVQMLSFALFVSAYFLQPMLPLARTLTAPENQRTLQWFPSYWFTGLFYQLSGAFPQAGALTGPLAQRALAGLGIAAVIAGTAFLLSYFRTLRKIVEEPDILPGAHGGAWLPSFGNQVVTALVQFSIRTLLRSRQHRMILSFYLGIGFAVVTLYMKDPISHRFLKGASSYLSHINEPMLVSSLVMLFVWVLGARVVFTIPQDLRANWIFRITPVTGGVRSFAAVRRSLLALSVVPLVAGCAALFLWAWPWRPVAAHLAMLGLIGSLLVDVCLYGFRKIPFTCSYLPGKSNLHVGFWVCSLVLVQVFQEMVIQERAALNGGATLVRMIVIVIGVVMVARWLTVIRAKEETDVQWEQAETDEVLVLGLSGQG